MKILISETVQRTKYLNVGIRYVWTGESPPYAPEPHWGFSNDWRVIINENNEDSMNWIIMIDGKAHRDDDELDYDVDKLEVIGEVCPTNETIKVVR